MNNNVEVEILTGLARVEANQESMKDDISEIKMTDIRQNELLAEHIAGVQTNKESIVLERQMRQEALDQHKELISIKHDEFEVRLKEIEFLPNFVKDAWKILKWVGGFAAVTYTIIRILPYL